MRRRCLAALAARQQRCRPRIAATTTATKEPLPWLEEQGIAVDNQSPSSFFFRARFLGSDARGFAAKSLKDAARDSDKVSASPSLPRERIGGETAKESAESSSSSSTSSSSRTTAVAELAAVFTCNVCDLRSAKGFSRVAFERGVVIVTCEGCESMHVLADRLGWFGSAGDAADFLKERRRSEGGGGEGGGEGGGGKDEVRSRAVLKRESPSGDKATRAGVLELMPEDLEGWSSRNRKKGEGGG